MGVYVFDDFHLLVTEFVPEGYWDEDFEEYEYHSAIIDPGTYTLELGMKNRSYAALDSGPGVLSVSGASGHVQVSISVVPIPSAFLLGFLGLSFASWKLRRRKEL